MYDTHNRAYQFLDVGGGVKRWTHWGSRGAFMHWDVATLVGMPFIRCMEEEAHDIHLALIVRHGSALAETVPIIHSLEYVTFPSPFNSVHLLNNLG